MSKNSLTERKLEPYLYLAPTIVLFVFILAIPLYNLVKFSLGDSNIIQGYLGWNNFESFEYLTKSRFLDSVQVTLAYVFSASWASCFRDCRFPRPGQAHPRQRLFRAVAIIPWVVPQAFAATMWKWVVNSQFGFINQLLLSLNIIDKSIGFLSADTALATVIVVRIWQGTPFMIISLLAALQTIPENIQEAASLDGASLVQRFRYITLPYIRPVLKTTTLIVTAWTMQLFDVVYIMTAGGPARKTQLVALEIYNQAFKNDDLGTACALSLAMLAVIFVLSLLNRGEKEAVQ